MFNNKKNIIQSCILGFTAYYLALFATNATATEFNLNMLDADDKAQVDFSRFSQVGYILPGTYPMKVLLNGTAVTQSYINLNFIDDGEGNTIACLPADLVAKFALKEEIQETLQTRPGQDQCIDMSKVKGYQATPDLADGFLRVTLPGVFLEYSDASWLPPSQWEEGINGVFLDYNLSASFNFENNAKDMDRSVSLNGTFGGNLGAWRIRADYQGNNSWSESGYQDQYSINRIYAYRALPSIASKLTIGEQSVNSDIFDSWLYTGVALEYQESMVAPNKRGYAPQINGIADTNAQVIVSQQGRVIYDTTVPAGPFSINDLSQYTRGTLDVEVIEQDGSKKTFQVDASYIPNLTRSGQLTYKGTIGNPRENDHDLLGNPFVTGELTYGLSNNWSLYGGLTATDRFGAVGVGVGHDLRSFGSLSVDVTQSYANIDDDSGSDNKSGSSIRVSYAKQFESLGASLNFAGYRFATEDYMNMQKYLDMRYHDSVNTQSQKNSYSLSLNQNIPAIDSSIGLQYGYQSYWDAEPTENYTLSLYTYVDIFDLKGISLGLSANRYEVSDSGAGGSTSSEDSYYISLNMPFGSGRINYSNNISDGRVSQYVGYSDTLNDGLDNYSIRVGANTGGDADDAYTASGYYSTTTQYADLSANIYATEGESVSLGVTATGGLTITGKGSALHSGVSGSGARMLVKTDEIAGVPINGGEAVTNSNGVAVVTGLSNYYRNNISIDLNRLPKDIEAKGAVTEAVLTEGAIGYREFEVLKGKKFFAQITLKGSEFSQPPFGASVLDEKSRELGMVGDEGIAWVSGAKELDTLSVVWGEESCKMSLPETIKLNDMVSLTCEMVK